MLDWAEETKVFDFLSCVKYPCKFFSVCIKFNFIERIMILDMNEISSFPHKFSYQNVNYVKLTKIKIIDREMFK